MYAPHTRRSRLNVCILHILASISFGRSLQGIDAFNNGGKSSRKAVLLKSIRPTESRGMKFKWVYLQRSAQSNVQPVFFWTMGNRLSWLRDETLGKGWMGLGRNNRAVYKPPVRPPVFRLCIKMTDNGCNGCRKSGSITTI